MLKQDLGADENEHDAAGQGGLILKSGTEFVTDQDAKRAQGKGGNTDDGDGYEQIDLEKGEGDTDGQGVDAGGYGHQGKLAQIKARTFSLAFLLLVTALTAVLLFTHLTDNVPDHFAADEGEQGKGDPVVNGDDVILELAAQQVADGGHERLKAAEKGGDDEHVLDIDTVTHLKTAADGHGKGVHGQPHTGQKNLNKSHNKPFYVC